MIKAAARMRIILLLSNYEFDTLRKVTCAFWIPCETEFSGERYFPFSRSLHNFEKYDQEGRKLASKDYQ